MKKILLSLLLFSAAVTAWSVPAKPGQWRTITLTDGTQIRAELVGDEHMHFWQGEDGGCYVERQDQRFERADREQLAAQAERRRAQREQQRHDEQQARRIPIGGDHQPYEGSKRGIIILVEFQNKQFEPGHDLQLFEKVANKENYKEGRFYGSVHDYFYAQSKGVFDLSFDVVGPIMMKDDYQHYGMGNDVNVGDMVVEGCLDADSLVNFADYDWDGDGSVDQVFFLYAGKGEADGGGNSTIWPHEWELNQTNYGKMLKLDGVTINTYACGCELNGRGYLNGPGTICHEFSHCLGLPDMYDTKGNNYGMGTWSIMDKGTYNDEGYRPAGYTSYERMYCGWLEPIELADEDVSVDFMAPLGEDGDAYILRNSGTDNEYYLLENRQQTGWDANLANSGMLMIHVDYDPNVWLYNCVNAIDYYYDSHYNRYKNDHQRCTLLHADNSDSKYSENGDTYPYKTNNSITSETKPAAFWYNKTAEGNKTFEQEINNIKQKGNGFMSFDYKAGFVEKDVITSDSDTLFVETFDNCNQKGGNDDLWAGTIGIGDFNPDHKQWRCDYARGGYHCARIGSTSKEAPLTSPYMQMDGSTYTVSFRAAPWFKESAQMVLKVTSRKSVLQCDTLPVMTAEQWNDYEVEVKTGEMVTLEFSSTQRRFFIDEVKVYKPIPSAIRNIKEEERTARRKGVYSLDGQWLGTDIAPLPRGIYIVDGRKVVK